MRKLFAMAVIGLFVLAAVSSAAAQSGTPTSVPVVTVQPAAGLSETWTFTYIAQQDFQRGFMFWLSSTKSIWVLTKKSEADNSGDWKVYQDTFVDGDLEIDPSLTPPQPGLYQPRRGFGKIWRDKQNGYTDLLGWGTTPEFAVTTPIGYMTGNGAGRYMILTLGRQVFSLIETTPGTPGGKWTLVGKLVEGNAFANPEPTKPAAPTLSATAAATAALGPVTTSQSPLTPTAAATTAAATAAATK